MRKASKFFETYFRKHSNDTKKRKLKAEHPSDRTNKRAFTSCKKRRPRDVSLVSVVLGGSRGQVFVSRFAQRPFFATLTAFCCCHVRYDTRKVRYVADAIVASSRRPYNTKSGSCMYTYAVFRPGKSCCCGDDQLTRLVHRAIIGSPRVMVQHACVVVGDIQLLPWYHP